MCVCDFTSTTTVWGLSQCACELETCLERVLTDEVRIFGLEVVRSRAGVGERTHAHTRPSTDAHMYTFWPFDLICVQSLRALQKSCKRKKKTVKREGEKRVCGRGKFAIS